MSENKEVLKDMLKGHRSQFEQVPTSQIRNNNLTIKIMIVTSYNPINKLGIYESILIAINI